jgi:receptor protein-tyrosine kinase
MSKITQALEKAARERLSRTQEQVTVNASAPVTVPVVTSRIGEIASAGTVHIDPHIVAAADPQSPIAEQYRILRTNFHSLRLRQGPKVIVVTSAVNGEGKSVTAINLAMTLAGQEHLRVVLVDADMRKSSVPKWLGLKDRGVGLSTVLERVGEPNGSLVNLQSPPLTILPAGPVPDRPSELLESTNMKRLLATLRTRFDLIIIDAPPVLPVADPGIIAAQADGVLLVVRAGKTQRKTVLQAQELLKKVKANLLGCVLTHVEYYLPGYHRYYHYYRYSAKDGKAKPDAADRDSAAPSGNGKD